ncbi:acyl-CoA dehydrogenase family protein [Klenkia brasiliensis]|uniref:Acyl-CoA dehydrogenase n=1 Tax=Klenkia brasiliensis TaxID=333142 RepID=A0A1G7PT12_9ACTN|nr:acyl-CoA dehydrogenase family protein [Klenkia brasiliensis]SDF88540.1 Acyl-CoA dehydrogenase [Klenkia brasiliensis]
MPDVVARARSLADELLFPQAGAVDAAGAVPRVTLDTLAAEGLYGLTGPVSHGGLAADPGTVHAVAEAVAGGDLSAAFIWLQHLTVPAMVTGSSLADEWLADLCAGRRRSGIALLAATRPQPVAITARRERDAFVLDGGVPWVTGWGQVDVVLVAARDADDVVHFLLVDAEEGPTLTAVPQQLVAVQASATVEFRVSGHVVPASRLVRSVPLAAWQARDPGNLRANGSLALGLAARCARLAQLPGLDADLATARARLDAAGPEQLPDARAAAAALAHRAAGLLAVAAGSGSVSRGHPAERLSREALFLLVFGSRPAIKAALLHRLGAAG